MGTGPESATELEELEVQLLLEGVYQRYGFDFQEYDRPAITPLVRRFARRWKCKTISGLQEMILHQPAKMDALCLALSESSKSELPEPSYLAALRREIVPLLRTYPFVRIWQVGCSSPLSLYLLSIVIEEEGLAEKTRIYATEQNETLLSRAESGLFPATCLPIYADIYRASGGRKKFAEYCNIGRRQTLFKEQLKKNIVFAQHQLSSDSSFNVFNLILSRKELCRFSYPLLIRALQTFYDSLEIFGLLALGPADSLSFTPFETRFSLVLERENFYRKLR